MFVAASPSMRIAYKLLQVHPWEYRTEISRFFRVLIIVSVLYSIFLQKFIVAQLVKKICAFLEPESSLLFTKSNRQAEF
jgi:hypothetical protein